MTANLVVRRLTAIMFTDVVGYSTLMATDEWRALAILDRQRALSIHMIRRLHEGLRIPVEVLIQAPRACLAAKGWLSPFAGRL